MTMMTVMKGQRHWLTTRLRTRSILQACVDYRVGLDMPLLLFVFSQWLREKAALNITDQYPAMDSLMARPGIADIKQRVRAALSFWSAICCTLAFLYCVSVLHASTLLCSLLYSCSIYLSIYLYIYIYIYPSLSILSLSVSLSLFLSSSLYLYLFLVLSISFCLSISLSRFLSLRPARCCVSRPSTFFLHHAVL